MVDETRGAGEGKSAEPISKLDQERLDFYVGNFFKYAFGENQVLDVDDRTAREIINTLPIWQEEIKKNVRARGASRHDMGLVDSVTLECLISSTERQLNPAMDRIQYEPKGPVKEDQAKRIQILQSRQGVAKRALEIREKAPPPAK